MRWVVAVLLLSVAGCAGTKTVTRYITAPTNPTPTVVATTVTTSAPVTQAPTTTTTPAPVTLLNVVGEGGEDTATFTAPSQWELHWSYDCSAYGGSGNFAVDLMTAAGGPDGVLVNSLSEGRTDIEYVHTGGSVYLSIDSECNWHIQAIAP
jgi:hypothetical protein